MAIRLPQLPNLRSNLRVSFLWTSIPFVEPPNKLFMHDAVHIARRFAGSESGQNGTSLRFVFIGIRVLKRDSNRVVPKEQRSDRIKQVAIFRSQLATFLTNLFACSGHVFDDKRTQEWLPLAPWSELLV
jgi:hypothetical protein